MKPSTRLSAPIITFLSPDVVTATRACEKLQRWTALSPHKQQPETRKRWGVTWEIHSMSCPESGTTVQYMSSTRSTATTSGGPHSLLAIQEALDDSDDNQHEPLFEALAGTKNSARLLLADLIRRPIAPKALLGSGSMPVLHVKNSDRTKSKKSLFVDGVLKEIALPFFNADDDLQSQISVLPRVVTGLYQLSNGLALRPLPASQEDRALPPPSLIFHSADITQAAVPADPNTLVAKIGCSGVNRQGQTMVRHADTQGMDIRFCASTKPSSVFSEAQESLLASSLEELQSTNVLKSTGQVDPRTLQTDCWVEFRANMARPSGFLKSPPPKIAKAPDLPFE